MITLEWR